MQNSEQTVNYRQAEVSGFNIFYREAGSKANPTILLLHGFPSSSHVFRDLIPQLADKFYVVAPDYPGFGYSDAPDVNDFEYTFDNLASIVDKFLEQQTLGKYILYMQD